MVADTNPRGTLKKAKVNLYARKGRDWYYTVYGQTWRCYNVSADNDPYWVCASYDGRHFTRSQLWARTRKSLLAQIDSETLSWYHTKVEYTGALSS